MKIAYLTNCFGTQSHTFIRREIGALRTQGVDIQLFGVRRDFGNCAPDAESLVEETHYLYPISVFETCRAIAHQLGSNPGRFFAGAWRALSEDEFSLKRRLKMLYHFLVSTNLVAVLKAGNISHIHAHFMNASASIAMFAAYHARIPFSITVHSAGTYGTPHILGVKQKLKEAQMLMMISHYNIDYFDRIYPCKSKSHVVRCGMNLGQYQFEPAPIPTTDNEFKLLGVGRFVEKKGFIYLIKACALLVQSGFKFRLDLIGDGPLLEDLKSAAASLGLNDLVSFRGKLPSDQVAAAMKNAGLVIVPSVTSQSGEMEGLPVVIMEAMALGTPVVATSHSGIPEIIQPERTGQLVPEKDPASLAEAIRNEFLRRDNSRIIAAKELLEEQYNIDTIGKQRKSLFLQADKG